MMRAVLTFFVMFTWCIAFYSQEENTCEHPDYNALMALYEATGGESWTDNSNWDDGTRAISCDPCADNWYGVGCNSFGRVDSLDLQSNNLTGTLPTEIAGLSHLRFLILPYNSIGGQIPNEIVALQSLKALDLSGNRLDGAIPEVICGVSFLEHINLNQNSLTGEIPSCIGDLSHLVGLLLGGNALSGTIPKSLGTLSNLVSLTLSDNNLSGVLPEGLGDLSELTYLYCSNNNLTGCFPQSYTSLCDRNFLRFGDNASVALNDISWSSFCSSGGTTATMHPDYPALVDLYHSTNGPYWSDNSNWDDGSASLSCDPCADDWYGVTCIGGRVAELRLANNNLSGSLPSSIGDLDFLEYLSVFNNLILGEIPEELGGLGDLEYLDLGRNQFTGSLPPELGYLFNLEDLYIDNNFLEGCWPDEWGGLCEVDVTEMDGNLSPTISDLGWTNFCATRAGTTPEDYDPLISIYKELDGINWVNNTNWEPNNSCVDPCDDWFGVTCTRGRVTGLDLSVNDLKGIMPNKIGGLTELSRINMVGNEIKGDFLEVIGSLEDLTYLNMKGNQISGKRPWVIPWSHMDTMHLGSNYLYGEAPDFYNSRSWSHLNYLNLSNNLFSGHFQLSGAQYGSSGYISVANNYLSGCFGTSEFDLCALGTTVYTHGNLSLPVFQDYCSTGDGGCNYCSVLEVTLDDDPFELGFVEIAKSSIISDGRVGMDNSVLLQAGQEIELDIGFTVETNSNFILRIEDCDFSSFREKMEEQR